MSCQNGHSWKQKKKATQIMGLFKYKMRRLQNIDYVAYSLLKPCKFLAVWNLANFMFLCDQSSFSPMLMNMCSVNSCIQLMQLNIKDMSSN